MRIAIIIAILLTSGCAQTGKRESLASVRRAVDDARAQIAATNENVDALHVTMHAEEHNTQAHMDENLTAVERKLDQLRRQIRSSCPKPERSEEQANCPEPAQSVVMGNTDKMVLGEVENVLFDPPGITLEARMDTGASSSSLHATNITEFERDGEDWVRFDISDGETTSTVEKEVKKFVRVFQQADRKGSRRPVVDMRISLGNIRDTFEFTLADRSHLEHNLILGRNFLKDIALVDVSREFIQPAEPSLTGDGR